MTGKERVIEVLRREGACGAGLRWLRDQDRNVLALAPDPYVGWFVREIMPKIRNVPDHPINLSYYRGYFDALIDWCQPNARRMMLFVNKREIAAWFDNYDLG